MSSCAPSALRNYPCVQIIFALSDATDPALATVRRLQREFAALDIELVIDPTQHGSNRKISNLINMLPSARHDLLVMADSDIAVPRRLPASACAHHSPTRRSDWSPVPTMVRARRHRVVARGDVHQRVVHARG